MLQHEVLVSEGLVQYYGLWLYCSIGNISGSFGSSAERGGGGGSSIPLEGQGVKQPVGRIQVVMERLHQVWVCLQVPGWLDRIHRKYPILTYGVVPVLDQTKVVPEGTYLVMHIQIALTLEGPGVGCHHLCHTIYNHKSIMGDNLFVVLHLGDLSEGQKGF